MDSDHPVFTRAYGVIAAVGERTGLGHLRRRVLADARGRLLIVGLGPGHDLEHLPEAVTSVVSLEPSESMRAAAHSRVAAAAHRGIAVEVVDAVAEAIPLPDDSVDSVLVAYVLCSVNDPNDALAEIRRVLRPQGTLHVLEHVRARPRTVLRGLQRAVGPIWPHLAGRNEPHPWNSRVSIEKTLTEPRVPCCWPARRWNSRVSIEKTRTEPRVPSCRPGGACRRMSRRPGHRCHPACSGV